ncbi:MULTISPECIES: hypothetical protein [Streptomyces]|uniref:Integral membrane protein n=2 Tax=Streptomyces TaxID=1883 RepID=A0ABT9LFQ1_STRGD|nr:MULTISPECIES: hypothetical protein [Streptomyces]MDP9682538.1 hypothetical protein [Streptomyces griseoviridis]GGS80680.1 membrane protein [Streptomyces griseoviridis]GGU19741.1 membrane protein [Streptomyces daghestanicus]GHI32150.1 membrane protein [Streptomyces daghestanicus]
MGIESDQVVYEYLSRVGDVAQQRQLPSAARMRLVADLRNEIDKRRSKTVVDSPAAVRRILDRLGSPDEVVEAAGGSAPAVTWEPPPAVPVQPDGESPRPAPGERPKGERPKGLRRVVPRPRPAAPPPPVEAPAPPHLAQSHELADTAGPRPDWWRTEGGPFGRGDQVPGFVGGIEIPDLLKPPPPREKPPAEPVKAAAPETAAVPGTGRRRLPRLFPRGAGRPDTLLLCAAVLLAVGAILGNLLPLALGWVLAFLSRRLTPVQAKWAVLGLPGLTAAAGVVWLWGRTDGRWGDPITEGHMNEAVADTWPWVLRAAALASAAYLVWRARRRA